MWRQSPPRTRDWTFGSHRPGARKPGRSAGSSFLLANWQRGARADPSRGLRAVSERTVHPGLRSLCHSGKSGTQTRCSHLPLGEPPPPPRASASTKIPEQETISLSCVLQGRLTRPGTRGRRGPQAPARGYWCGGCAKPCSHHPCASRLALRTSGLPLRLLQRAPCLPNTAMEAADTAQQVPFCSKPQARTSSH